MSQRQTGIFQQRRKTKLLVVAVVAVALSACTTSAGTPSPDADAPANLFVPANLSVSSIDGEAVRWEPTEPGQDPSLSIPPGLRNIVVEWIRGDGGSSGRVELTKTFEAGKSYRLLRARTSVFLIQVE